MGEFTVEEVVFVLISAFPMEFCVTLVDFFD